MSVKRKKRDPGDETAAADAGDTVSDEDGEVAAGPQVAPGLSSEVAVAPAEESSALPPASTQPEAAPAETKSGGEASQVAVRLAALEAELAGTRDQLLRKAADFDNFRKRMTREKEETVRFANTALLADLIEVIDGLELAVAAAEGTRDFDSLHRGVVLIEKQLVDALERKWGLVRMRCAGRPFDPALHQAVLVGDPAEGDVQLVLDELQSGYYLHDRVVRPAKVRVSAPRRQSAAGASEAPAAG